jgi:2'-5' RNA ligase
MSGSARLFVAVDIGDAVRQEATRVISVLRRLLESVERPPKVVWVKPAALHVTIKFLGEVDEREIESLQSRLAPPIEVAPFEIEWRGVGTFPSNRHPRALWLGVINGGASLAHIEAEVSRRVAGCAAELNERALLPHLTLGRVKMAGAAIDWPKILKAAEVRQVSSRIDRVVLFRSRLSQHGPHYTELASAPLVATTATATS